jgi:hypothetical protein
MRYIGTGTVTSVTVTTATDITMVTSDGGTDAYTWANYTTVGALCDAINKDGIFEAHVVDSLRSESTGASDFMDSTITAGTDENGVVCYDLKWDTDGSDVIYQAITPFRNFNVIRNAQGHRVVLQGIEYYAGLGTPAVDGVAVYLRKGTTETKVWAKLSVNTTVTTLTFVSGYGEITSQDGGEIIVKISGGAITASASNYVQVIGRIE